MATAASRRTFVWLRKYLADLCLIAALIAALTWSWNGPPRPAPDGLQAAARIAVHRHLGSAQRGAAERALHREEQTARASARIRDPG